MKWNYLIIAGLLGVVIWTGVDGMKEPPLPNIVVQAQRCTDLLVEYNRHAGSETSEAKQALAAYESAGCEKNGDKLVSVEATEFVPPPVLATFEPMTAEKRAAICESRRYRSDTERKKDALCANYY